MSRPTDVWERHDDGRVYWFPVDPPVPFRERLSAALTRLCGFITSIRGAVR